MPRRLALHRQRGVEAGDQALRGGFLVAGGAVDLAGEVQAGDRLGFQPRVEPARIEIVVFDRVAGAGDVGVLEPGNRMHQRQLHVVRQRGGDAVRIDLERVQSFGLDEDLVRRLLGEAHHLVLDRRTVARADALDLAGVQRRAVQCAANDPVGALAGMRDPAADLARVLVARAEVGEHRRRRIAGLLFQAAEVDAAQVDARRRAGLQAVGGDRQFAQLRRQRAGRRIAGTATGVLRLADMDLAGEEGAGGEHHRAGAERQAHLGDHAGDAAVLDDQVVHRLLEQLEVRLAFHHAADRRLVQRAVGLAAGGAHGRTLRRVQRAPLDAGAIRGVRHRAAQRVDLLDQVALADAADGGIAAHLADRLDVVAEQQRARTGARGGQRGLGAGVAAADHDDVVVDRMAHRTDLSVQKVTKRGAMVTPSTPCGPIGLAGTFPACGNQHFQGQTLRDYARRDRTDRGSIAYQERKQDGTPRGAVAFCGVEKRARPKRRGPAAATAAGPRADRSGARRSQEQGESRMTVLPSARNRKSSDAGSCRCRGTHADIYRKRVNKG